jgi:hypothetical protein
VAKQNYLVVRRLMVDESDSTRLVPVFYLIEGGIRPKLASDEERDALLNSKLAVIDENELLRLQDEAHAHSPNGVEAAKKGPFVAQLYNVEIEREDNGDIVVAEGTGTFSGS